MKQTVVEWLEEIYDSCNNYEKFIANIDWEQAKAMEKEQIIDAYKADCDTLGHTNAFNAAAEQYYNKTFKSE